MTRRRFDPESLADRLDALIPPGQTDPVRANGSDDPLIESAVRLANAPHPRLSVEAMRRIQQQMFAAKAAPRRSVFRATYPILAAACVVLILLLVGPLVSASVPGDPLYSAKRTVEQVELAMGTLLQNEAAIRLKHAEHRTHEAVVLVERGEFDAELVDESLAQINRVASLIEPDQINETRDQLEQITSQLDYAVARARSDKLAAETTLAAVISRMRSLRENHPGLFAPPVPANTPTETPAATPTHTPTPTLTATASNTPSATPTTVPTATVTPTASWTPGVMPSETSIPELSATETPQPVGGYVLSRGLVNVRQGPGMNYSIIARANPGDRLIVIGENPDGDWFQIRLNSGIEGWIASSLVAIGDAPPAAAPITGVGDENSPPDCPGNSCNAPGQTGELPPGQPDCPGGSCNAPGQTGELPPGQPDCPGGSCNAPANPPGGGRDRQP